MDPMTTIPAELPPPRRGVAGAGAALAACGSSGPSSRQRRRRWRRRRGATYWYLTGQPGEGIRARHASTGSTRRTRDAKIKATTFQNDAYKTKIKTAIGAGQAPDDHLGLGRRRPEELRRRRPGRGPDRLVRPERRPSRTGCSRPRSARPRSTARSTRCRSRRCSRSSCTTTRRSSRRSARSPRSRGATSWTWCRSSTRKGIAPFSLGGQSRWTNMMWLEFLFDRIGGPEVFQAVFDGEKDAWSNPAALKALDRGAEPGQGQRLHQGLLLDHRRLQRRPGAALHRQGRDDAARRLDLRQHEGRRRRLRHRRPPRLHELPAGRRRQGRPERHRRQPRPVPARSRPRPPPRQKDDRQEVLRHRRCSTTPRSRSGSTAGNVPIVKGSDSQLAASDRTPTGSSSSTTPRATPRSSPSPGTRRCSPTAAEALLDNIAKLFQLSISPQQFADNMNEVIGT